MLAPTQNNLSEYANYAAGGRNQSLTAASRIATDLSASTKSELTLVTAEGDRVTLSARAQMAYQYGEFNFARVTAGGTFSANVMQQEFMTSSAFEMQVEGDLNEQEMSDVRKLVASFKSTIEQFFSGDLQGVIDNARAAPGQLAELETVAQFDYSFDLNAEFTRSSAQILNSERGPQSASNERLQRGLSNRGVAPDRPQPSLIPESQISPEAVVNAIRSIDELAGRLIEQVREHALEDSRIEPLLPDLVGQAISELQAEPASTEDNNYRVALGELRNELIDRFKDRADHRDYRVQGPESERPGPNRVRGLSERV